MRVEFHQEALEEYELAALYYASCRPGLGQRFITNVESIIGMIADEPRRCRRLEGEIRRCLTRVFPYAVLYSIEFDYLLIIAIMHCHREPGYWGHRLPAGL
jgi:toxin ParE1/3/4